MMQMLQDLDREYSWPHNTSFKKKLCFYYKAHCNLIGDLFKIFWSPFEKKKLELTWKQFDITILCLE